MGKKSRDKGYRIEREVVALHRELGIEAARVPLSGAAGHKAALDIAIEAPLLALAQARRDGCDLATPALCMWKRSLRDVLDLKLLIDESEKRL